MSQGRADQPDDGGRLVVVWSQDAMWQRTALQRAVARYWRRAAVLVMAITAYVCTCAVLGVAMTERLLRLPRRAVTTADVGRARAVADRTGSRLADVSLLATDTAWLRAWWIVPQGRSRGTVILLHGQADNRAAMLGLAELLLADGYRALLTDVRAHGTSGGALTTYGVRERHDLRQWADWARRQHPDDCVFAAGSSMGAAILLQSVSDVPYCAAIADSPFADLRTVVAYRVGAAAHLPRLLHALTAPVVTAGMLYARLRYGVDLATAQPVAAVSATRVPVLVVHGGGDTAIPVSESQRIGGANPRRVGVWIVAGAPHTGAWAAAPRDYPARVLGFLAAHQ